MHVHYFTKEQVEVHLRGLAQRLLSMADKMPSLVIAIGYSGDDLTTWLLKRHQGLQTEMSACVADVIRGSNEVVFENDEAKEMVRGRHVIIMDSFVKTGEKMAVLVKNAEELGAQSVCSYALALRRSSQFVPRMWGVMVDDHELVIIPRDDEDLAEKNELPPRDLVEKLPELQLHLRLLSKADLSAPLIASGDENLDMIDWPERWTRMERSDGRRRTYLLESKRKLLGYVTLLWTTDDIEIEELAVSKDSDPSEYVAAMFSWAVMVAEHDDRRSIRAWIARHEIDAFLELGFETSNKNVLSNGDDLVLVEYRL